MSHIMSLLHKAGHNQSETVQVYIERLYTLALAFEQLSKVVVEPQLVGFFIYGLYHNYLPMTIIRKNPEPFQP